jgi:hypothetical protein
MDGDYSRRSLLAMASAVSLGRHRDYENVCGLRLQVLRNGKSDRRYLLIHGNESTAREVLTQHLQTHRGTGYAVTNLERNIEIQGGKLDPNRMFSRAGTEASLRRMNRQWTDEQVRHAADQIDREREKLVRLLTPPPGGLLIALHNNAEGYSVNDEIPISDRGSIREPDRPHEFLLCTIVQDFDKLSRSPYNVVLQNQKPTEDDGSLSRLAAARGIRYVNLEVSLGNKDAQVRRLAWIEDYL